MTTSGVTSSYTYDPWGRLASRSATISGQNYTATYTYRFGDKLQRIDSNFSGINGDSGGVEQVSIQ